MAGGTVWYYMGSEGALIEFDERPSVEAANALIKDLPHKVNVRCLRGFALLVVLLREVS